MLKTVILGVVVMVVGLAAVAADSAAVTSSLPLSVPRIGVVLGGGGARGFAHLGVLRELEKLRIPISCISGASAGALIGGIYANGLPLEEINKEFRRADWDALLSGRMSRQEVPFDRKRDDFKNYTDLTFGVRGGQIKVPRSAINSQEIDLLIRQLTRDRNVASFDSLPIPFRAIATDLSTGEAVVFDKGALSTALRASMAVPGLFDLVEDQERLLIDGSVARTLPIQDIKHRCADHVIVVDVSTPLLRKDEILSLFDVVTQTTNIIISHNVSEQMKLLDENDIVIRPKLDGFSTSSFAQNQDIIERGSEAAQAMSDKLASLSVSADAYAAWKASLKPPASPMIDEIRVVGSMSFVNQQSLAKRLNIRRDSEDVAEVRKTLREVFAQDDYDRLSYSVQKHNGRQVMTVLPRERSIGPNYIRFGLNLESSTPGTSNFTMLASHLRSWVNSAGASWRNEVTLGNNQSLLSEFYQPLSVTSSPFVAASAMYNNKSYPLYDLEHIKVAAIGIKQTQFNLDAGVAMGKYGEFRIGGYQSYYYPSIQEGRILMTGQSFNLWKETGLRSVLIIDQFDNPRWPRHGYFLNGELRVAFPSWGEHDGRYYFMTAERALTFEDVTFLLTAKVGGNIQIGNRQRAVRPQFLGGFLNLTGYQYNELGGSRTALARLMSYWRFSSLPSALGSGLYAGGSLEAGNVWQNDGWSSYNSRNTGWLTAASLFLGADTLLGPMFVGIGTAKGGRPTAYLFLGINY